MTIVQIRWFGAYNLVNSFFDKNISLNRGVYAISRIYRGKETLLYIGKTKRSFLQRIREHNKIWLWNIQDKLELGLDF